LIPDAPFCAPIDPTTNVDTIKRCLTADSPTTCNEGCQWRQGREGDNSGHQGIAPVFSTELCHPASIKSPIDMWTTCVANDDAADCSIATGCGWSEGKDLIPDHDFCAPIELTKDVAIIHGCVTSDSATTCG